jgi:hypothetical protein
MCFMSAIQYASGNYVQRLPQNMEKSAAASFLVSFTASTVFSGGNVALGFGAGVLAASASLLHSLIRPIIEDITSRPLTECGRLLLQTAIILSLSALAGPFFGISISVIGAIALAILSPFVDAIMGWQDDPFRASSYIFYAT